MAKSSYQPYGGCMTTTEISVLLCKPNVSYEIDIRMLTSSPRESHRH